MPHCQIVGPVSLPEFHRDFRPRAVTSEGMILKAEECFLSSHGRVLMLECLVAEGYLRQGFFILVTADEEGAMVRLLPRTSPEKTEGVKRCLAFVARWLRDSSPGAAFGKTNLQAQLEMRI